jgi:hypothetical protein
MARARAAAAAIAVLLSVAAAQEAKNATAELLAFANTTISSVQGLGLQANSTSSGVVLRGAGSSALQPLMLRAQQLAGGQGRAQRQGFDVSYDALGTGERLAEACLRHSCAACRCWCQRRHAGRGQLASTRLLLGQSRCATAAPAGCCCLHYDRRHRAAAVRGGLPRRALPAGGHAAQQQRAGALQPQHPAGAAANFHPGRSNGEPQRAWQLLMPGSTACPPACLLRTRRPARQQQVPIAVAATGFYANLPSANLSSSAPLRMDACTLARIFTGNVTSWDDPAIQQLNPGARWAATGWQAA